MFIDNVNCFRNCYLFIYLFDKVNVAYDQRTKKKMWNLALFPRIKGVVNNFFNLENNWINFKRIKHHQSAIKEDKWKKMIICLHAWHREELKELNGMASH